MKNLIFFVISTFIFSFPLHGQENISVSKRKEVAFTNISLGGASILLKKEVKPNVFIRNAFGYGRIQASKNQNVSGFNSSLNYSIGKEKRKNLIKSLDLSTALNTDLAFLLHSPKPNKIPFFKIRALNLRLLLAIY